MDTKTIDTSHLLDASLPWLHSQSVTWMRDTDFWKEEATYFYNLLRRKELRPVFPGHEIAVLEKEIVHIMADELEPLKMMLTAHERSLKSYFIHATSSQEAQYRNKHRDLMFRRQDVENRMREFKQKLFGFIQAEGL